MLGIMGMSLDPNNSLNKEKGANVKYIYKNQVIGTHFFREICKQFECMLN